MGDALYVHGGVTDAREARLAQAGLIAVQAGGMDSRTGVMAGPGSTALVTGTASTAPMQVSIAPHQWVASRGAANGPYLGALEATQLVNVGAAPASGTRIDVVYVKQGDATAGVPTPDATTAPVYGVLAGTVGAGKPNLATVVGAEELATVSVASTATRTDGAGVTISNTARQTVARGAPVPCRNQAEQDALTTYEGLLVNRLDVGRVLRRTGALWRPVGGDYTLGDGYLAAQTLLSATDFTDIATVTATSTGGECVARMTGVLFNGNSGTDRVAILRVLCDGTQIGSFGGITVPLTGLPRVTRVAAFASTPGAGAHTWKLQGNASAASAVFAETGLLTIIEKG